MEDEEPGWLESWVNYLLGTFSSLLDLIVCAIKKWFCWAFQWFIDQADAWLISPLLSVIPDPPESWDFEFLRGTWATLDLYFPASESVVLVSLYFVAYAAVMAYRVIKRHIPGLA